MTHRNRFIAGLLIAVAMSIGLAHAVAAAPKTAKVDLSGSSYMSERALRTLYSGKTWKWTDGAGYFLANGQFLAYSRTSGGDYYARGHWYATSRGRLCFSATWRSRRYARRRTTCFQHRDSGAKAKTKIFQRKLQKGSWYVFKHENVQKTDEFLKLTKGLAGAAEYRRIRRNVVRARQRQRKPRRRRGRRRRR